MFSFLVTVGQLSISVDAQASRPNVVEKTDNDAQDLRLVSMYYLYIYWRPIIPAILKFLAQDIIYNKEIEFTFTFR